MGAPVFYLSIILTLFVIILAVSSPSYKYPLLASILARPVIDATWSYRYTDFNLIYVLNGTFILIFLYRLLFKKEKLFAFRYAGLFGAYLLVLIFISFHVLIKSGYVVALEFFFKSFFMPLSFYLFYRYFSDRQNGKLLSTTLVMAGLFPLSIVLVQIATGSIGRFGVSRGLTRVSGLYHDIVSTRSYFVLTFIGILLYWRYFLKKTDKMRKIGLIILFSLLIIALFHQYSKTIIATGVIWAILFLFYERRVHIVALFLGGFLILNAFSNNKISSDIQQVFSKEVELVAGRSENTNVLAGRIMMWGSYMRYWHGLSIIEKLIGPGIAERPFHNDYIRILFNGGVIFLAVSVLIMFVFLVKINKNYARSGKFIHFIALISLAYFFVESVGATPGMYLNIQAIVWGLVGLSMNPEFRWQEA